MFNPLGFLFRKKKRIIVNYNASDLSENEKTEAVNNENAYLKGVLSRIKVEEAKKRESEKDKNEEQETIKELNHQKKDLVKKDLPPFSLFKLFEYGKKSKKKPKKYPPIHLTTFDGKKDLGIFKNIAILPDGGIGIAVEDGSSDGKIIWGSSDIKNIFYWVAGMNNFAKARIIPLCINSEYQFQPNIMAEEIPELVVTTDKKFKINRYNTKPVFELLQDTHIENEELRGELQSDETVIAEQQKEINEKDREANLHKNRADKAESALSMSLHSVHEIEKVNSELVRQNMTLINLKDMNEQLISSMEGVVKKWGGKIEENLGSDMRSQIWDDLKNTITWAKNNTAQVIYQMPEKPEPVSLTEKYGGVKKP